MAKRASQANDLFAALDSQVGNLKRVAEAARREKTAPLKKAAGAEGESYSAADIEVLEVEPGEFATAESAGEADEQNGRVTNAAERRWQRANDFAEISTQDCGFRFLARPESPPDAA